MNEREFPRGIRFLRVSSSVLVGALFRRHRPQQQLLQKCYFKCRVQRMSDCNAFAAKSTLRVGLIELTNLHLIKCLRIENR